MIHPVFRLNKKQRGVGLMESILAIAIASFSILALGKLLIKTTQELGQSESHIEAIALAEQRLESFRSFVTLTEYEDIETTLIGEEEIHHGANSAFTLDWSVTPLPSHKRITVTVSWLRAGGIQEQVQLSTNIARVNPVGSGKLMITL